MLMSLHGCKEAGWTWTISMKINRLQVMSPKYPFSIFFYYDSDRWKEFETTQKMSCSATHLLRLFWSVWLPKWWDVVEPLAAVEIQHTHTHQCQRGHSAHCMGTKASDSFLIDFSISIMLHPVAQAAWHDTEQKQVGFPGIAYAGKNTSAATNCRWIWWITGSREVNA